MYVAFQILGMEYISKSFLFVDDQGQISTYKKNFQKWTNKHLTKTSLTISKIEVSRKMIFRKFNLCNYKWNQFTIVNLVFIMIEFKTENFKIESWILFHIFQTNCMCILKRFSVY